jgi:hypothetical protein
VVDEIRRWEKTVIEKDCDGKNTLAGKDYSERRQEQRR